MIRHWTISLIGAALVSASLSPAAQAITIDYVFSGAADYTLNGVETTGSFTLSMLGDTANVVFSGGEYTNVITAGNATFTAGTSVVTLGGDQNSVIDNTASPGFIGFGQLVHSPFNVADESFTNSIFQTYNLQQPLALTTGDLSVAPATFQTSGGDLTFNSISELSFQASAVPEPSTWAMMILGFLGLGFMASRRKNRTGFSALIEWTAAWRSFVFR